MTRVQKNIFIHLNYTLDTFNESKVVLVSMRYFQWCTTDFKYGVLELHFIYKMLPSYKPHNEHGRTRTT